MTNIKQKIIGILVILISLFVLVLSVSGIKGNGEISLINSIKQFPQNPFETSLSRARFSLIKSLGDEHTFIIDAYASISFPDVIYSKGHYYSVFIPGPVIVSLPFYLLGKNFNLGVLFVDLVGPIATLLSMLFLYKILRKFHMSHAISLLSTFLMVFASDVFVFSTIFNAHPLSMLAITMATYGVVKVILEKNKLIGYSLFWFSFGMAIFFDYPNLISLVPFTILLFLSAFQIISYENRKVLKINLLFIFTVIFALIGIIPIGLYTYHLFGTIFTTIEPHQIQGYFDHGIATYKLPQNPNFFISHKPVYKLLDINPQYVWLGLFTLLISLPRGLFLYFPIFILSLFGIKPFYKQHKGLCVSSIFSIILTTLVYACYADFAGGWSYGSRFFIGITPIFFIFFAYAVKQNWRSLLFSLTVLLASLYSISVSVLGALNGKLLASPLENHNWGITNTFFNDLANISKAKYASFFYDYFIRSFLSRSDFFYLMLIILLIFFLCLFIYVIQTERKNYAR